MDKDSVVEKRAQGAIDYMQRVLAEYRAPAILAGKAHSGSAVASYARGVVG